MTLALASRRTALTPPWVRDSLWRRARAVPSLDLRFADNKSLTDAVTGASLVTFTRASNGTFVDSAGVIQTAATDVPRFDHNPTTGESLGLLVEEARTNLLLRSEEFGTTWAAGGATITSNSVTAPNGALTADTLVEDTSLGTHSTTQFINVTSGTTYTLSVYAKPAGRNFAQVLLVGGFAANITAIIDITNGTVGTTGGSPVVTSVNVGNGWYRLSITSTATSTTSAAIQFRPAAASTTAFYQGDGTSGIYLWGAQLEAGAFPTSYIPTTTAAATRNADVASITGSAFSGWYSQSQGTIHAAWQFNAGAVSTTRHVCNFNDGVLDQLIGAFASGANTLSTNSFVAGTSQGRLDIAGSPAALLPYKSATAYAASDRAFTLNGVSPVSGTGSLPSVTKFEIGFGFSASFINGHIRRLCYWNQRLPNSTLQTLTQ